MSWEILWYIKKNLIENMIEAWWYKDQDPRSPYIKSKEKMSRNHKKGDHQKELKFHLLSAHHCVFGWASAMQSVVIYKKSDRHCF